MSGAALAPGATPAPATAGPAAPRRRRLPLALKLAIALIGLVTLILLINGGINLWLNYDEAKRAAVQVQQEKAQAAAERVDAFISDVESQIGWTTRAEWRRVPLEQQRYDFIRLLRQAPAVTEVSYLDPAGKEQLKVSRLEPDTVGSGKDFSTEPRFAKAVAEKVWFGPVYFRRGSEPYMTVAVAHAGRNPGVTAAEVNLKLVWDVITAIKVGDKGYAFVVTAAGRLIAHPDLSLVLRDTDLSKLPQVAHALPTDGAAKAVAGGDPEISADLGGSPVLTAYALIRRVGWLVFVQSPVSEALAPVYRSLTQALMLLGFGLLLATLVGSLLARRMVVPIRRLQEGAERLGSGDLSQRIAITSGDEIETLADRFNQMAGRIQESYETLEKRVEERTRELSEALQYQSATGDVLNVISRSPSEIRPVLDTIVETAGRLCEAYDTLIFLRDADVLKVATHRGAIELDFVELPISWGAVSGRAVLSLKPVHVADVTAEADEFPDGQAMGSRMGYRTILATPLLREDVAIGAIIVRRTEVRPFTERQIELVQTFADQAVIAIENARLFEEVEARTRELSESLKQQTATAEVLQAISRSTFDLEVVLDTLVDSAVKLCESDLGSITRQKDGVFYRAAMRGFPADFAAEAMRMPVAFDDGTVTGRALRTGQVIHIDDVDADPNFRWEEGRQAVGFRTLLGVPLLREGTPIGAFALGRRQVRPYSERQIELVQTFADQAVIAIENARLFEEVQAKTREVTEALVYQTGSADILRVIASSPTDVAPVLDAIAKSAHELCEAQDAAVLLREGDDLLFSAHHGPIPIGLARWPLNRRWTAGRAVIDREPVHVRDLRADEGAEFPDGRELSVRMGHRSILSVPMIRDGQGIGAIVLRRLEVQPFSDKQITLLKTFADQAVIAIQNTRLFEEVQARTRELSQTLEYQTATSEVLNVISRTPSEVGPVFSTIVETAARLCEADQAIVLQLREGRYHLVATREADADHVGFVRDHPLVPDRGSIVGRTAVEQKVVHVPDCLTDPEYSAFEYQKAGGYRTMLGVPLLREGVTIGVIMLMRKVVRPFDEKEIGLVTTFADQAVIAIGNVRLFEEVQARTRELQASLDDLSQAQDRLVQSEKLASLGQLTAGIAHEIKNPLNFVNNFSSLSADLIDELNEVLAEASLDEKTREEVDELTGMLKGNLDKVVSHGKRADSIVKNMLLHSREGSGDHRPVDVNALVEESMNLAYHGARAEKPGFNVTLVKDFDPGAGQADLYPQEVTRVLLNLIGNGFYAATKRKAEMDGAFEPTLSAATRSLGDRVEIRIRDNGTGIPDEVRAKMFNPFFTTKPAGEGTGLGLSLSHDIVVKQHGGSIDVATQPGAFTEFTIVLPRGGASAASTEVGR